MFNFNCKLQWVEMNVVKKVQWSDCRCVPTWNLRKKLKVKVFIRPVTVSKSKCHYLNKKSAVALQTQKTITDEIVSPVYPRTRKSTESWMQMPTVRDVLEYHHRQSPSQCSLRNKKSLLLSRIFWTINSCAAYSLTGCKSCCLTFHFL